MNIQRWISKNPQKSNYSIHLIHDAKNLLAGHHVWGSDFATWKDFGALVGAIQNEITLFHSIHPINSNDKVITHMHWFGISVQSKTIVTFYAHLTCHRNRATETFQTIKNTDNKSFNDEWIATNNRQHFEIVFRLWIHEIGYC